MSEETEARLIELESRVAFQDDALRKLDELAAEQARQLFKLSRELAALKEQFKVVAPSLLAKQEDEEPPPHY